MPTKYFKILTFLFFSNFENKTFSLSRFMCSMFVNCFHLFRVYVTVNIVLYCLNLFKGNNLILIWHTSGFWGKIVVNRGETPYFFQCNMRFQYEMSTAPEWWPSQVEVPDRKSICPDRNERTRWRRAFKITRSGKKMNAR